MKKKFVFITALVLILVISAGCSGGKTTESAADEFTGKFSGESGSLEFLPEGKVEVDFSPDYTWMVGSASYNKKTLEYVFITKNNSRVSFDQAEFINFYNEKGGMIISNPCKVQKDSIVLYPAKTNETILNKETK
jgi:hypothetical protein